MTAVEAPIAQAAPVPANSAGTPPRIMRQFELVERVKSYDPSADEDALNRAYVFSMKAHGSQMRLSGDPYFSHPVEVAGILAGMKLDGSSIITGLLHDTVEDTVATLEDIERLFGADIARLVDGVTKLSRLELQSDHTRQAENFRKLVLAMSEDIRVLLVKLADRLHNMRTLRFIADAEKRRRIARETMEIYAPLAERMGMHEVQDELEDMSFAELYPEARESIIARLSFLRQKGEDLPRRIMAELSATLREAGIKAELSGREKSPNSIWRKMQRKNVAFEQLADIMAFRIVVDDVEQCYHALGRLARPLSRRARPLQGLHLDAQAQQLPLAPHRRHRPRAPAHRGADPHARDARGGRAGRRRALGLQAVRALDRGPPVPLAARAPRYSRARARPAGIPRAHQARDVSRPRVLLHAQGRSDRAAAAAPRRSISPMPSIRRSATPASAPRSTAASCPCARSSSTATRSRS